MMKELSNRWNSGRLFFPVTGKLADPFFQSLEMTVADFSTDLDVLRAAHRREAHG
jgi:predicted TIM-barrel enzyme